MSCFGAFLMHHWVSSNFNKTILDNFLFEIPLEDEDVRASFCIYVILTRCTIDEG